MSNIAEVLCRGIKEGKWIDISYKNSKDKITYFWIAIISIDFEERILTCEIFNKKKKVNAKIAYIFFDNILSAETLTFTTYYVPRELIYKLENASLEELEWLDYNRFNCNILSYYQECNFLDTDPFQKEFSMIKGIDLDILRKNKCFTLSEKQSKEIIDKIYHKDLENVDQQELAISVFSISEGNKKYVVCYYPLKYNPKNKTLICSKKLCFNSSFLIDGRKRSINQYIDCKIDDFTKNFKNQYKEFYEMIKDNLRFGEVIDTRPDIMILQRSISANLGDTYQEIERQYNSNLLSKPLKAFFGKLTRNKTKKEPSIAIIDKKINIDQMRVLYNSMKQPVTYVQGPPGTGKTQTLLNVLLCNFINDNNMLICSSNNKPVDSIVEKINFKYKGMNTPFPFLRLGNKDEVAKGTKKIYELYNYESRRQPKKELIEKIKINNDRNNEKLRQKLEYYEKRLELIDLIENGNKLLAKFNGNQHVGIIDKIKEKVHENEQKLKEIPFVTDESVVDIFTPVEDDPKMLECIYFMSLYCINKLKEPKYSELIDICAEEDDSTRVQDFNKWCQDDKNMKLLMNVFPVIFSTNISCSRLGTTETKFNLVVIDEAGQCNVAHALLPISRAEKLLLVGDTNQLKPVILLDSSKNEELLAKYKVDKSYDYCDNSILSVMQNHDTVSKKILLSHHYRCGYKIINFSNKRYYQSLLKIEN